MFGAILLTLLGADRETVTRDYLRSNDVLQANLALASRAMPPEARMTRISWQVLSPLAVVEQAYLDAAFQAIEAQFGSFENYRREAMQIGDEVLASLQEKLLAEAK